MTLLRASLLLACVGCAGCSLAFVRPAPTDHEKQTWVSCTSSRFAPIADVAGALEFAGTAAAIQALSSFHYDGDSSDESRGLDSGARAIQIAAIGLAAVEVASAAYGFRHTAECERAKDMWETRMMEAPARPGCRSDTACKNGRHCVQGLCMWPPVPPAVEPSPPATTGN